MSKSFKHFTKPTDPDFKPRDTDDAVPDSPSKSDGLKKFDALLSKGSIFAQHNVYRGQHLLTIDGKLLGENSFQSIDDKANSATQTTPPPSRSPTPTNS